MPIHSMTGFAQVRGQVNDQVGCTLSLKAVNHRFLDLQLRLPPDSDLLEMKLRRELRQRLHRGHVELTIALERTDGAALNLNRALVGAYIKVFRAAAAEFGISSDPDLNGILRLPGRWIQCRGSGGGTGAGGASASGCGRKQTECHAKRGRT